MSTTDEQSNEDPVYPGQCFMQLIALCKLLKHHAASGFQFSISVSDNAWLLSFECSVHALVVMKKYMEKLC